MEWDRVRHRGLTMGELIESWGRKERMMQIISFLINRAFRYSQYLLEWIPYKENRVCCVTLTRKGYADNMMYVAQALMAKRHGIEIAWVTKYPDTCGNAAKNGVRIVKYHTAAHFYLQLTSRVIISEDSLYHGLIKRKGQTYLNVWHGGINYKRLGMEGICFENPLMEKLFKLRNPSPDYMVAGSRFFAENMRSAFGFDKTVFLKYGLPRNDMLFHDAPLRGKVKRFYGIDGKRVILYAPTFRSDDGKVTALVNKIDFKMLAETAHRRYGGEWAVFYRVHYFSLGGAVGSGSAVDVSGYRDISEILIDTDILISDYSSCMWDFSFMGRPIIAYVPDEKNYCERDRGFTEAGRKMPYPKAKDMAGLLEILEKHDFAADSAKIKKHHEEMGAYDCGNAAECVAGVVLSRMRKEKINIFLRTKERNR